MEWCERNFLVGFPHMSPGQLSEVELLKILADDQWQAISSILKVPASKITNDQGERLYASVINVELSLGQKTLVGFSEGTLLHIRHAARFYARRFVEGFFCFDDGPLSPDLTDGVLAKEQLEKLTCPWIYLSNAFVAREDSNSRLKTFAPSGASAESTDVTPPGIRDHELVERTGELSFAGIEQAIPIKSKGSRTSYEILRENDLNGAGLLYFARYIAIANYGERQFLFRHSELEVSSRLTGLLTTTRRKIFYFANADENDSVEIIVNGFVSLPEEGSFLTPTTVAPLKFTFVTELRRKSDGVMMAKTVSEKHLVISKRFKNLLLEAGRVGKRCGLDVIA
jgi:probable biosynthetic protein (TIGR04098 family)